MMYMGGEEAFAAYESVRHRLPEMVEGPTPEQHRNLDAIADRFDVFLLDAFGVLNVGEAAIPEAPERIAGLQRAGKRVMVVSNAASYPHERLMTKYEGLGFHFDAADVISSRQIVLNAVAEAPPLQWGVIGDPAQGDEDLADLDHQWLADDAEAYDQAERFLMLGSSGWTEARQKLLESALQTRPRPIFIGNPDIVAPREEGFSLETGYFAHHLADHTGTAPEFYGKPFGGIFDEAFRRLGSDYDPARIVMVGDTLHTDILGGVAAGVKTALIKNYGFFSGSDAEAAIAQSGIVPDFVLEVT